MLALNNNKIGLLYNEFQETISNKCVNIFVNSKQFCHFYIYGTYSWNEMSDLPISSEAMINL